MHEVEIIKVTFKKGKNSDTEVIDAHYFEWLTDARNFANNFNANMPIDDKGYITAWKPTKCVSLTDVLIDAFNTLRQQLEGVSSPNNSKEQSSEESFNSMKLYMETI